MIRLLADSIWPCCSRTRAGIAARPGLWFAGVRSYSGAESLVCRQQWTSLVSLPKHLGQGAILLSLLVALTGVTLCRVCAASPHVSVPPLALPEPPRLPSFTQDIQPIFNQRCIACHGCLGSPCNLKLDSFEGAARGGFGINPYATHLADVPRTDMDAAGSLTEWRSRGFYSVLGQGDSPQERLASSLMVRLLAAGMASNQPGFPREGLARSLPNPMIRCALPPRRPWKPSWP